MTQPESEGEIHQVTLYYRATDIPADFSASEGARREGPVQTPMPIEKLDITTSVNEPSAIKVIMSTGNFDPSAAGFAIGAVFVAIGILFLIMSRWFDRYRTKRRRRIHGPDSAKSRTRYWRLGVVPTFPTFIAIPIGIFTILFGARTEWQESLILRWDSKDAVLRFMQIVSIFMRMCATTLAWGIVRDCGWLILAGGMPAVDFIGVWNISAANGGYL